MRQVKKGKTSVKEWVLSRYKRRSPKYCMEKEIGAPRTLGADSQCGFAERYSSFMFL